jgi:rSAM/selenodomain-associated transferase 1
MNGVLLIVFAKAPQPGLAKTRLIPALGEQGAAALARRMLQETLASAVAADLGQLQLCLTPAPTDPAWRGQVWPAGTILQNQGEGDLGQRMLRAFEQGLLHAGAVILIGTDCPQLQPQLLRDAAQALQTHDAVLYPTSDGGYVLLGLRRTDPRVFADIAWSSASVAETTRLRIRELGWSLYEGPLLHDIDTEVDLPRVPQHWLPSGQPANLGGAGASTASHCHVTEE